MNIIDFGINIVKSSKLKKVSKYLGYKKNSAAGGKSSYLLSKKCRRRCP